MAVEVYVDNSVIDKIMITIMSIIRKRKKNNSEIRTNHSLKKWHDIH